MKRIATMALAAATFIAPLATPISATAQDWRYRDQGRNHDRGRGTVTVIEPQPWPHVLSTLGSRPP